MVASVTNMSSALEDAEPVTLNGQEIGRCDDRGQFIPAARYWAYDEFYGLRPPPTCDTRAGQQALMAALIQIDATIRGRQTEPGEIEPDYPLNP